MAIEINIPSLDLSALVTRVFLSGDSWDVSKLGAKVGHLEGTGDFGSDDNIVLTGHSILEDGSPGIFEMLSLLEPGEEVIINRNGNERRYNVTEVMRVDYDDLGILDPSELEQLTLMCVATDSYDEDVGDYLERHVVIAKPEYDDAGDGYNPLQDRGAKPKGQSRPGSR